MINQLKQWARKNRTVVIALSMIVLLVFMTGNQAKPQTVFQPQPICDGQHFQDSCESSRCYWTENANTIDKTIVSSTDVKLAKAGIIAFGVWEGCGAGFLGGPISLITVPAGCIIGYALTGGATNWIGKIITWFKSDCRRCIPDGYITDKSNACCSGYASPIKVESITGISLLNGNNFACWTPSEEEQCKPGFMGDLGKFVLDSGLNKYVDNCSTASLIGIGGGLLFFVLILSFI